MFGKPHPEQDQIDLYGAARLRSGRLLREITTTVSAGQNSAYDLLQPSSQMGSHLNLSDLENEFCKVTRNHA